MDLFDIAVAKKLSGGGGGGGGGDSDFSTATVTIINHSNTPFIMNCAVLLDYEDEEESIHSSNYSTYTDPYDTTTESVILYKGKALANPQTVGYPIAVTGGIVDDGMGAYIITGDCTITIS